MAMTGEVNVIEDSLSAFIDAWKTEKDTSSQERLIRASGEQERLTKLVELQYQNFGGAASVRATSAASPAAAVSGLPTWAKVAGGIAVVGGIAWVVSKLAH